MPLTPAPKRVSLVLIPGPRASPLVREGEKVVRAAGGLYRRSPCAPTGAIVVVAVWLGLVVLVRLVVWGVGAETSNDLSLPGTKGQ